MHDLNETNLHENRQLALVELVNYRFGGSSARCAEALGMSRAVISAWSTGAKTLGEKAARNIESLLGIPDEALVKGRLGYFESWDGKPASMSIGDPRGHDSRLLPLVDILDGLVIVRHQAIKASQSAGSELVRSIQNLVVAAYQI